MNRKRILFVTLAALLMGGGILWYQNLPRVAPEHVTWADAQREAELYGYRLITTQKLAELYRQDPHSFLLVDTRPDWAFMAGYIKGALNFPIEPSLWGRWRASRRLPALLGPDKNRTIVFHCAGLA